MACAWEPQPGSGQDQFHLSQAVLESMEWPVLPTEGLLCDCEDRQRRLLTVRGASGPSQPQVCCIFPSHPLYDHLTAVIYYCNALLSDTLWSLERLPLPELAGS